MTGIAGVILAGGRSSRMGGGDKALLPLQGKPMLAHVIARLAPQVARLLLNANGDAARFAAFGLPVAADRDPDFAGPLAGILAGLEHARAHWPKVAAIVSVPGDTPFIPLDLVGKLEARRRESGAAIVLASSGGRMHPTAALWSIGIAPVLADALAGGERRVMAFIEHQGGVAVDWPALPEDPFANVNTPEDLALAERRAARF